MKLFKLYFMAGFLTVLIKWNINQQYNLYWITDILDELNDLIMNNK